VSPLPKPAAPTLPSRGLTPAAPPTVSNNGTAVFRRADAPTTPVAKPTNGGNGHAAPAPSAPIAMPAAKTLLVSLARIADNWPDTVKAELAQFNLTEANTALPANEIEAGLKRGKVTFSWKFIRSNITPNAPANLSPNDDVQLDLPLAIITPLFFNLGKNGGASAQKRVAVDEKIPNLFFGFPKPEPAPAAPAAPAFTPPPAPAPVPAAAAPVAPAPQPSVEPADTNYFIWDDEKESGRVDGPATPTGPSPGTNFLSRKATPNEVVQRAVVLEGVYGAMVALPDGLLVAAKLDASLSGDTVAALIPQMYSKLSGCTKELRMGELNNLHFTVGNVPWKIFRVNGLFFAAYGAAGQALPSAELARLASDLDYRKAK
jgi:predicted regulator of Ras-like GTPase activity (Roadblock/LC7/MglB family)